MVHKQVLWTLNVETRQGDVYHVCELSSSRLTDPTALFVDSWAPGMISRWTMITVESNRSWNSPDGVPRQGLPIHNVVYTAELKV